MFNHIFPAYVEPRFIVVVHSPFVKPHELETGFLGTIEQAKDSIGKFRHENYPLSVIDTLVIFKVNSDGSYQEVYTDDPIPA